MEGEYGFTRCVSLDEPAPSEIKVGDLTLRTEGRTLTIHGLAEAVDLAAFSGPAPAPVVTPQLGPLASRSPHLALILGGFGDTQAQAKATLTALGELPFPVLMLPGGRDGRDRLVKAMAALGDPAPANLVLLDRYRSVRFAGHEFVLLPGAERGRYGLDASVCGFDADSLSQRASDLGDPEDGVVRSLWSWTAPARGGVYAVSRTHLGLDVGSVAVAEFADRVGAAGGLFAWPAVRAVQPASSDGTQALGVEQAVHDLRIVVPRLGPLPLLRSDGSRVPPGFVLLRVDAEGVRLLGRVDVDSPPGAH